MHTDTNDHAALPDRACGCGTSGCSPQPPARRGGASRGLLAAGAAAVACLVCLVPGAAVALGAAGVVAFTPLGVGGALLAAATALALWRVLSRRGRA